MNNYLLPEFTPNFNKMLNEEVKNHHHYGRIPREYQPSLTLRVLRELININLNPLTFEEVKAWFDKKVSKERPRFPDILYGGEHSHESYGRYYYLYQVYEVNYYRNFYIAHDGFKYSLNSSGETRKFSELLSRDKAHYSLCELTGLTPLELFCQIKGYING